MDTNTPRRPSASRVQLSQVMSLSDANLQGNVHGGVVMKLVDTAAGMSAIKHAGGRVVTVAMDEMSFLHPVMIGDLVTVTSTVNDTGRTSMEVGVRVEAEDISTGRKVHTSTAYLVFVALDSAGNPRAVPPLDPQTPDEMRRQRAAKIRRSARLRRKQELEQDDDRDNQAR